MHFAYQRPDGGVSVVHLAPKARLEGESDEAFLERVKAKVTPPDATNVTDRPPLPSRAYRDAWMLSGGKVQHDMAKARAAKLAEIRAERNRRLAESDALMLRAQETGDTAEAGRLKAVRQRLRDLPATVDLSAIEDADALKAWEPNWPAQAVTIG